MSRAMSRLMEAGAEEWITGPGVDTAMSSEQTFAVTWDYRCPFARNGHEHMLDGLEAGAPWEVTFVPFFLNQSHVPEGGTPAWEDPAQQADLLSLAAGVVVRDRFPEQFLRCTAPCSRHATTRAAICATGRWCERRWTEAGADADAVLAEVDAGWPAKVVRDEHERMVERSSTYSGCRRSSPGRARSSSG